MRKFAFFLVIFLVATSAQAETRFGILYAGWHCLVTGPEGKPYGITSEALAGRKPWAAIPSFHYWAEPREGFYCLSERPDILRRHATMLRDAGIDFIVFDASNVQRLNDPDARVSVVEPFLRLIEVWREIQHSPKIVPWAPLTAEGDVLNWMLSQVPTELQLQYEGKPLVLVTDNELFRTSAIKIKNLEQAYTVRKMWGLTQDDTASWSFLSVCQLGFLTSGGQIPCRQRRAIRYGEVEQVAIAPAYQETYMSNKATAVPRFHGRTFVRQFERLFDDPTKFAIIANWNEWMAQRFCLDGQRSATDKDCNLENDHWPDGTKVFVDQYDEEYSRDIEPTNSSDFYYRLMQLCIAAFKVGQKCSELEGH